MRLARVRPNHPPIVNADSYRLGDIIQTLDQRGTLLGRLVLEPFIEKNRLWYAVPVPVRVEVEGAPFDGDGVVAAAWVGFAVQSDGAIEAAFADVAPLGLSERYFFFFFLYIDRVVLTAQMKSKTTSISMTDIVWWVRRQRMVVMAGVYIW